MKLERDAKSYACWNASPRVGSGEDAALSDLLIAPRWSSGISRRHFGPHFSCHDLPDLRRSAAPSCPDWVSWVSDGSSAVCSAEPLTAGSLRMEALPPELPGGLAGGAVLGPARLPRCSLSARHPAPRLEAIGAAGRECSAGCRLSHAKAHVRAARLGRRPLCGMRGTLRAACGSATGCKCVATRIPAGSSWAS